MSQPTPSPEQIQEMRRKQSRGWRREYEAVWAGLATTTPEWARQRHREYLSMRKGQKRKPKPARSLPREIVHSKRYYGIREKLLDAAAKIAQPGEVVRVTELARSLGAKPANAHAAVRAMREIGRWPYASAWDQRGKEQSNA